MGPRPHLFFSIHGSCQTVCLFQEWGTAIRSVSFCKHIILCDYGHRVGLPATLWHRSSEISERKALSLLGVQASFLGAGGWGVMFFTSTATRGLNWTKVFSSGGSWPSETYGPVLRSGFQWHLSPPSVLLSVLHSLFFQLKKQLSVCMSGGTRVSPWLKD